MRRPLTTAVLFGAAIVLALGARTRIDAEPMYAPRIEAAYDIETVSGSHRQTFPAQNQGATHALDVDRDGTYDVSVRTTIDASASTLFTSYNGATVVAPTIAIDRHQDAVAAEKAAPPLRVVLTFTITDTAPVDPEPPTLVRFGYEVKEGGAIPTRFNAAIGGLENAFNPIEAIVSTGRTLAQPGATYEGPVTVVAGFDRPAYKERKRTVADFALSYQPLPADVRVKYTRLSDGGLTIDYEHRELHEVDLDADVRVVTGNHADPAMNDRVHALARVNRLPSKLSATFASATVDKVRKHGRFEYRMPVDAVRPGRGRPDVSVDYRSVARNSAGVFEEQRVVGHVETVPDRIRGSWNLPHDECKAAPNEPDRCLTGVLVEVLPLDEQNPPATLPRIGAAEAYVTSFVGADPKPYEVPKPTVVKPWVPERKQFANIQVAKTPTGLESYLSARIENVNRLEYRETHTGLFVDSRAGDGAQPLAVHAQSHGNLDRMLDGSATVAPLPDALQLTYVSASDDGSRPMQVTYDASRVITSLSGGFEYRRSPATRSAACGTPHTACVTFRGAHLPKHARVTFVNTDDELDLAVDAGNVIDAEGKVVVDPAPDAYRPKFSASGALRLKPENPAMVADVEVHDLPTYVRARFDKGDRKVVRVDTCRIDYSAEDPACAAGTEQPLGRVRFAARNFVNRPAGLKEPVSVTPLYATYAARPGTEFTDPQPVVSKEVFEATGHMTHLRSVEFRTDKATGLTGLRTRLGDATKPFSAQVDMRGVPLSGTTPADLVGTTTVNPLPSELSFCMRSADKQMPSGPPKEGTLTFPCETRAPFEGVPALERTPTSVNYTGNAAFDVLADFRHTEFGATGGRDDDSTIQAKLDVENVPTQLTAHVQTPPPNGTGPIRARFLTPTAPEPVKLTFSAAKTGGALTCRWPRPVLVKDQGALCMKATVPSLPVSATFSYDPAGVADNVRIENAGAGRMDVKDLELSSVKGDQPDPAKPVKTSVLVAHGSITGLPKRILGTLRMPGTIDFKADPATDAVGAVNVGVRNFLAPDPTPKAEPAQRAGLPQPDQRFVVFQRGDLVRAEAKITDLVGAGYFTVRDSDGKPLDTSVVRVDFGKNQVIRTYADLQFVPDPAKPDDVAHVIGDVTLVDVPAGIDLCFRGTKTSPTEPVAPTYCDVAPEADEGAFQVSGRPSAGTAQDVDVHAFVRAATAGGADVMAGRIDIDDIPRTVQGTFSTSGRVTFAGLDAQGNPDGIDRIALELADYDLQDHGYAEAPWGQSRAGLEPFPDMGVTQFLQAAANDENFHVRGAIGAHAGEHGSAPRGVFLANEPCPTSGAPDYPHLPVDDVTAHTCFRADFEQIGDGTPDPLHLDVDVTRGDKRIAVKEGRIENIPGRFQINLAETAKLDSNGALRDACGSTAPPPGSSCMAPFVRIDTSEEFVVAGKFQLGTPRDVADLLESAIRGKVASVKASPTHEGWKDWGSDPYGIRASVGVFEGVAGPRAAINASARFGVPRSITLDQIQSWSTPEGFRHPEDGEPAVAKDIRIHFVARDEHGVVTQDLGQLAAVVHFMGDGSQIIVDNSADKDASGFQIPGELSANIYLREATEPLEEGAKRRRTYIQVDGRVLEKLTLRARVFDGRRRDGIGVIDARIRDLPAVDDTIAPGAPSFRARAEIALKIAAPDERGLPRRFVTCVFYCLWTQVKPDRVEADLDFEPPGHAPARRIDAYVNALVPEVAAEVRGFSAVDGGEPSPVTAEVGVLLDPMNIEMHAMIPVIGNFQMVLLSKLEAVAKMDRVREFRLWNNTLHLKAQHDGPGDDSWIFAGLQPRFALGLLTSGLALLLTGNPVVYGFTWAWLPEVPPPAVLTYYGCPGTAGGAGIERLRLGADDGDEFDEKEVYGFPNNPPTGPEVRWVTFGTLGTFDILGKIAAPLFCELFGFEATLMDEHHPGPPFGVEHHPIPGWGEEGTPNPPVPPKPQPVDLVVSGVQEYCGDHTFKSVTIPANTTLKVATTAGPHCAEADKGRLAVTADTVGVHGTIDATGATGATSVSAQTVSVSEHGQVLGGRGAVRLVAVDRVQVDGVVRADGVSPQTDPGGAAGNSGAGHGGRGGKGSADGSENPGGAPYGDHSFEPVDNVVPSEPGARGGGTGGGNGGGVVSLSANVVRISGEVTANGAAGAATDAGACAVPDNPNTEPNESLPNTGLPGAGGGSGGGVVVTGTVIDVTDGKLEAAGGAGGAGRRGGGGGGAGGVLKVVAPLYRGELPNRSGGAGGATLCPQDYPAGAAGEAGPELDRRVPASQVASLGAPYRTGGSMHVPYGAAAAKGTNKDFRVVLCGLHRPPQASRPKEGEDKTERNYGIDMPVAGSNDATDPCGDLPDGADTALHQLASVEHLNLDEAPQGAKFDVRDQLDDQADNGFWGLFTVVLKGGKLGGSHNDCLDRTDYFLPASGSPADAPARAAAYDRADCSAEALADSADVVVGIDNVAPTATLSGPEATRNDRIKLTISDVADDMPTTDGSEPVADQSGVGALRCSNSLLPDSWIECPEGDSEWFLTPGSGVKTVYLKVVDMAGNENLTSIEVRSDVTPPTGRLIVTPEHADGANGWYTASPSFTLTDFCDGAYAGGCSPHEGASGAPERMFEYWFDGGTHRRCSEFPCVIDTNLPGNGRHTFSWQAIDRAGNRSEVQTVHFEVDGTGPRTALLTGPGEPDGANGWYVTDPVIVINGADEIGGSGLVTGPRETPGAGVYYRVNGGPAQRYTGAFQVGNDRHVVCHWGVDVAGNAGTETCTEVKVDVTDPTARHVVAGQEGNNGWYVSPAVTLDDDARDMGSGVDPGFDPNLADLCGPLPARTTETDRKTPSGTCVSVDGGPFRPWAAALKLTTGGKHVVRSFSVDVAGRRSPLRTDVYGIDKAAPVSDVRIVPALTSAPGVYRGLPSVSLRALDNEGQAGVDKILYKIDGEQYRDYVGPFVVPAGTHTIRWRALDKAGALRTENERSMVVVVDRGVTGATAGVPHPTGTIPPLVGRATWNRSTHPTATLPFTVSDDRDGPYSVTVLVYGELVPSEGMSLLRRITTTMPAAGAGHVLWDGRYSKIDDGVETLLPVPRRNANPLVGPLTDGRYHFRVVVEDAAGNVIQTGDSRQIEVTV